ncbi:hypothetical protein [Streptomyces sp. H27-C3]|uniref:hypothetical protein n=1 Tax=Streptomyces sp. H27-C3 TaxID=3046305 RepID=UPI0024B9A965|nr:hypothetical protein [Streptomyces sp. H27-C3]MDJ0466881.1 hypothetical protein [Streptomyces sp. H27-C3]
MGAAVYDAIPDALKGDLAPGDISPLIRADIMAKAGSLCVGDEEQIPLKGSGAFWNYSGYLAYSLHPGPGMSRIADPEGSVDATHGDARSRSRGRNNGTALTLGMSGALGIEPIPKPSNIGPSATWAATKGTVSGNESSYQNSGTVRYGQGVNHYTVPLEVSVRVHYRKTRHCYAPWALGRREKDITLDGRGYLVDGKPQDDDQGNLSKYEEVFRMTVSCTVPAAVEGKPTEVWV